MTWPERPPIEEPPQWGVDKDPEPPAASPWAKIAWVILTILIILSLVLPWIAPYLTPRRVPAGEGLQALLIRTAPFV